MEGVEERDGVGKRREEEEEEACERSAGVQRGKTNYCPDNRQAMDFLPGLFCSSFI